MNSMIKMMEAAALGAAAMYLFDPDRGKGRRVQIRDRAMHTFRDKKRALGVMQRDFSNSAKGIAHAIEEKAVEQRPDDVVLEARIRSAMGRFTSRAGSIGLKCNRGMVELSGNIPEDEMSDIVKCVQQVSGVTDVHNGMDAVSSDRHDSGAKVGRLNPAECLGLVGLGAAMTLYGVASKKPLARLSRMVGPILIAKAFRDTEHRFDSCAGTKHRATAGI